MAEQERNYTIPLRRSFTKVPKYYRAKRSINTIKEYLRKHMKTEDVRLGNRLNEFIWKHGIKNPPGKVKVKVVKDGERVLAELEGFEFQVQKVQTEKTEKATGIKGKLQEAVQNVKTTDEEKPAEPKKEAKPKKAASKASKKPEPQAS